MADAWSAVVERESEWDEYARSEALAMVANQRLACGGCGQHDALIRVPLMDRYVNWGDGRRMTVRAYRCLTCMASDLVQRDFHTAEEKNKPVPGRYSPSDGRRFVAALD